MCQNRDMFWWGSDQVLAWLSEHGARQLPDGSWTVGPQSALPSNELIHELIDDALADPDLEPAERLRLGFGMLDHFDEYAVAMYLGWEFTGVDASHAHEQDLLWAFCREMLERKMEPQAVGYWLWVDWFEDPVTSALAFHEMVTGASGLTMNPGENEPLRRRIDRVLRLSGPVPWEAKQPVFEAALGYPYLHDALRAAITAAERDMYGQLDVAAASLLISRLPAEERT